LFKSSQLIIELDYRSLGMFWNEYQFRLANYSNITLSYISYIHLDQD